MKNTLKAKTGFKIEATINPNLFYVYDGKECLSAAEVRPMADYIDECKNGNNECAAHLGVFTTDEGEQYVYWLDFETEEYFISKVTTRS